MVIKLFNKKSIIVLLIIAVIYSCVLSASSAVQTSISKQKAVKVPIVMYHHFCKDTSKLNDYVITPNQFENDIKYIKEKGYTTITMTQLINYCKGTETLPPKPIIITIDDGFESIYAYVYPLMQEYDMCAVVGIVGSYADFFTDNQDHNIDYSYLDWQEINKLSKTKYIEIQNHSYNLHKNCCGRIGANKKYGESESDYRKVFRDDLCKNQEKIFLNTGTMPNTFVYPFGSNSKLSKKILKEIGFSAALTCENKVNLINKSTDLYTLKRFNRPNGVSTYYFFKDILE